MRLSREPPLETRTPPALELARRNLVFGSVALGAGVLSMAAGVPFVGPLVSVLGAVGMWNGFLLRTSWFGADALNRAWDATSRGRLVEAQTALELASSRYQFGYIRQAVDLCLARIAFRRGDLEAALAHTSAVVDRRALLGRSYVRAYKTNGHALRAVVRAAMGDAEGALADARLVRESPDSAPAALARAELGEAMVLERGGDRAALAAHLARNRVLFAQETTPRERAIVRAYQRLVRAKPGSAYRTSAPREPHAAADEPEGVDWIAQVAPAAAPFARRGRIPKSAPDTLLEPADADLARAVASRFTAHAAAAPSRGRPSVGTLVLVVVLFLAIWQSSSASSAAPAGPPILMVLAVFGVLFGVFAFRSTRARKEERRLAAAIRQEASGEKGAAEPELRELANSRLPMIAAAAHLHLAALAERRASFNEALAHCDRGLAAVMGDPTSRALSSSSLTPGLLAERAAILAAKGRDAKASAELAHLASVFPSFPLLARAERRVGVLLRARRGDFAGAAALAGDDGCDAPLPSVDDLLSEIARALASPEGASREDVAAIKETLRDDADARAWINAVAPAALASFEAGRAMSSDAAHAREAAAEEEAAAEQEAAGAAHATLERR